MTKEEALELLKTAPRGNKPSRINPSLTCDQAYEIVASGIKNYQDGGILPEIIEKRVFQIARNQRRPRY